MSAPSEEMQAWMARWCGCRTNSPDGARVDEVGGRRFCVHLEDPVSGDWLECVRGEGRPDCPALKEMPLEQPDPVDRLVKASDRLCTACAHVQDWTGCVFHEGLTIKQLRDEVVAALAALEVDRDG